MILRVAIISIMIMLFCNQNSNGRNIIVAERETREALPSATVFDRRGNIVGHSDKKGRLPYISPSSFPITVRYLGFEEKTISEMADTIFMKETLSELPEVVIESKEHKVLHVLAYVREYSTLSTYTDTVFLFREKMVDYMLVPDRKINFYGWINPRLLKSESYYRFTNSQGMDSVSNKCRYHFSWSDWINIATSPELPAKLKHEEHSADTTYGKYSPTEIWQRTGEKVSVEIDVLADNASRKWVANLQGFFKSDIDYEKLRVIYKYDNVVGDSIALTDITGYSYVLESNGRGHNMFMFNKIDEPYFVTTYAEVYIVDKEYIKTKEARKWAKLKYDNSEIMIIEPKDAPELQPNINELIARVREIDHSNVRQNIKADERMKSRKVYKQKHIGERMLSVLKGVTGISAYKSKKKRDSDWNKFKEEQLNRNRD